MEAFDDELLQSFLEESREHLGDIENDLLLMEEAGADIDSDLVNKVFRAAHSIKGGAGFMGLEKIKELSHKAENVLGMIRNREIVADSEVVNILLLAFDRLRGLINNSAQSNDEDISEHVVALNGITAAFLPQEEKEEVNHLIEVCHPNGEVVFIVPEFDLKHARTGKESLYLIEFDLIHDIHNKKITPFQLIDKLDKKGSLIDCRVDIAAAGTLESEELLNRLPFMVLYATELPDSKAKKLFNIDSQRVHLMDKDIHLRTHEEPCIVNVPIGTMEEVSVPEEEIQDNIEDIQDNYEEIKENSEQMPPVEEKQVSTSTSKTESDSQQTYLRVNIGLLDSLMNLAGELVLSRNQLMQANISADQNSIDAATQRINLVTSELQETIMLTRMQPVGNIFNKFPRVVRDMARDLGKNIELSVSGKNVELDKTMLEGLSDPLTHLVRNSADHGIEDPATRAKNGKSEIGTIWLKAYHQAGQVNIEIIDDGKGIDPEKVAQAAISKGLISQERVSVMSEKEKTALIFLPGFSTAEKVTDVSGRGVGMDVVQTNLDKLGGQVDIKSELGKGTTIRIKLPLTLAIIPSLMVSVHKQRYAIPLVNVMELMRIPTGKIKEKVEKVGDAMVVRLREELLPLISLRKVLDLSDAEELNETAVNLSVDEITEKSICNSAGEVNIVVVSAGAFKYGLVVDKLHDSEEIVVKPLGTHLKNCEGYAGATIMGNGRVALILDIANLARMSDLTLSKDATERIEKDDKVKESVKNSQSLLTFGNAADEKFAVPVGLVERIEKITSEDIENVGGRKVIKYMGGILAVYSIDEFADVKQIDENGKLLVIVFNISGKEIGLLATAPIDTVETNAAMDKSTLRSKGISGSVIINGKTILVIDVAEMIDTLVGTSSDAVAVEISPETVDRPLGTKILYAEDSAFFRNQVKTFLQQSGYDILDAEDGVEAWNILEEHAQEISMILTDIEMPNLDGIGLAAKVKQDRRFAHIPIVALTTLAEEKDVAKGKEAGVDEYQVKLDKDKLLNCVHNIMDN